MAKRKRAPGKARNTVTPRTPAVSSPREIAFLLTRRVHSQGGFLTLLLRYSMSRTCLSSRDRSLVSELTYGVQRYRNKIDYLISLFSHRPLKELDPEVLDILRLGLYQLSEMGTPAHAAVNETVELAKRYLGKGAGFVNAVMRRACDGLHGVEWPSREDLPAYLEIVHSHPRWLVDYMIRRFGNEKAVDLCQANNRIPTLTLRVNLARVAREELLEDIRSSGWEGKPSTLFPEAIVDVGMPYETLVQWLEKGYCMVQDESSMLVSHIVNPGEGQLVVDACAAPGGKSTHLAQLGGEGCRVISVDRNRRRLEAMRKLVKRMGTENIEVRVGDASRLKEVVEEQADAVLLDAPCSGLGTLRRNPDLKWKRFPGDIANLSSVQSKLLEGCAEVVRPGGVLVYSVCTFTREETEDVLDGFLRGREDFVLEDLTTFLPPTLASRASPRGFLQVMPNDNGMEGMFVARLRREG